MGSQQAQVTAQKNNESSGGSNHKLYTRAQLQNKESDPGKEHENRDKERGVLHFSRGRQGSGDSQENSFSNFAQNLPGIPTSPRMQARQYIAHLQRTRGNRAVEHLWQTGQIQRKLGIDPEKTSGYIGEIRRDKDEDLQSKCAECEKKPRVSSSEPRRKMTLKVNSNEH